MSTERDEREERQRRLRGERVERARARRRAERTEREESTRVRPGRDRHTPRLDQPQEAGRPLIRRPRMDPETFGKLAESFARFMGTARFLVYMTAFVALWIGWNVLAPQQWRFDPYAFIFLTLMLSLQASYAAPLILLAQNRQADRDRVGLEQDRTRDERNLADTEYLTREVAALRIAMRDVATRDFLRSELRSLLEELDEHIDEHLERRGLSVTEPSGAAGGGGWDATDGEP